MSMETFNPNTLVATLFKTSSTDPMMICPVNTRTERAESCNHDSSVIWFYDESLHIGIQRVMRIELNKTFKWIKTFTDKEKFKAYLNGKFIVTILIFSISSKQTDELCNLIKGKSEAYNVYELDINLKQSIRKSSNTWFTFSNTKELFAAVSEDLKKHYVAVDKKKETAGNENYTYETFSPPLGIFNSLSIPRSFYFLNKESLTFVLFQLLNKIIIQKEYDRNDLTNMWIFCREKYQNDHSQRKKIDDLASKYCSDEAILNYTKDSFLFRSLTEVFRREDTDGIYKFRYYIADLHKQLSTLSDERKLNDEQKLRPSNNKMTVYRGKKLPPIILQLLKELYKSKDTTDKLISINGFLSITQKKKIAKIYAGIDGTRDGYESVMFKLHIDRTISTTVPYAHIADTNSMFPAEKEILFSMGSIWRLISLKRNKSAVWTIVLRLYDDSDNRLDDVDKQLLDGKSSDDYRLFLLAKILYELGKYPQAAEFYHGLLEKKELSDEFKKLIRFNFAVMQSEQGHYTDAQKHLEDILVSNKSKTIATNETNSCFLQPIYAITTMPSQLIILNNIGILHQKRGDYLKAYDSFKNALDEQGSPTEKAIVNNNLGNLENFSGNIEEARKYMKEAVDLAGNSIWSKKFKEDLENVERQQMNKFDKDSK